MTVEGNRMRTTNSTRVENVQYLVAEDLKLRREGSQQLRREGVAVGPGGLTAHHQCPGPLYDKWKGQPWRIMPWKNRCKSTNKT